MSTHAAGFTLVEVVVALAIFVIGALAIVRIFPPSLSVIQNAGDRTTAANLSRDVLARFSSEPGLAPDAVYDDTGGGYNDFPGAVVGSISKNNSLPSTRLESDFAASALGHFRRIVGERHTVLVDSADASTAKKYILTKHPYDVTRPVEIFVEDRVNGVRVDENGYLDFREARLASDNSLFFDVTPATPLPGGDTRRPLANMRGLDGVTYYVSYRYKKNVNGNLRMQGVTDEPLFFRRNDIAFLPVGATPVTPANTEQVFQGRAAPGPNSPVIAGSVEVRFTRRITVTPAPTTPPPAATSPLGDIDAPYRGFYHLDTPDAGVVAGKTVVVNYTVRDWRWMVDDAAPAQTPVEDLPQFAAPAVPKMRTLPIRFLNNENTLPPDQSNPPANPNYVYSLLTYNPAAVAPNPSDASVTKFENAGEWNDILGPNKKTLQVNPKLSQVTYDLNSTLVAPRVRTVYWTLDGWAVQTTVAARDFLPYDAARSNADLLAPTRRIVEREPWREYYWISPTGTAGPNVYFHWGDAGKAVAITYQYVDPAVDTTVKTAVGNFTINDREEPVPSAIAGPSGFAPSGSVVSVTLSDPSGAPFYDPPAGGKQVVGILAVQGLSVRARTAWMDNGRYTQSTAAGYRP